jgi:rubrerythrin
MFRGFVKDEKRHLVMLQCLFNGMKITEEFFRPKETIKTVFSSLKAQIMERASVVQSEMDALRIALQMEKEGFHFYETAAANALSRQEKELFERLVLEENDHYTILNNTYTFLENTGQWYMYEEQGIVEG